MDNLGDIGRHIYFAPKIAALFKNAFATDLNKYTYFLAYICLPYPPGYGFRYRVRYGDQMSAMVVSGDGAVGVRGGCTTFICGCSRRVAFCRRVGA